MALNRDDIDDGDFSETGLLRIRLLQTKTTGPEAAPRLPLKGRAARAVMAWIAAAKIGKGPLFRPVSQADRPLPRRLSPDGLAILLRHRLELAGYPPGFASAHGLRAGFLTQAAFDGAPLQAAMQLSLHRSLNETTPLSSTNSSLQPECPRSRFDAYRGCLSMRCAFVASASCC